MAQGYKKRKYISKRPAVVMSLRIQNSEILAFFKNIKNKSFNKIDRKQVSAALLCFLFICVAVIAVYTLTQRNVDSEHSAEAAEETTDAAQTQVIEPIRNPEPAEPPNNDEPVTTPQTETDIRGNTTGNISNTGHAAEGASFIYYRANNSGHLYRLDKELNQSALVYPANARYINVADGYIYFKNWDEGGALFRILWNGDNAQRLTDEDVSFVNITDEYVYYRGGYNTETDEFGCIYKITKDGERREQLNHVWSDFVTVYDGRIFYANQNDGGRLYSMNLDGEDDTRLNDENTIYINAAGGYIYYCGAPIAETKSVYPLKRINLDGTGETVISDEDCIYANVTSEHIYYSVAPDKLCRVDLEGGGKKRYDFSAIDINVISTENGDLIFHYDGSEHYIFNTKTEERRKLE